MLTLPIIGDVFGFLTSPFEAAAGWAWDTVVGGITNWIVKGVLALLTSMWNFMDTSSSPRLTSDWFYLDDSSPFRIAFGIGATMVALCVVFALIRAVAAGSPGAVIRTVGHDLPIAIFSMVSLVVVAAAAVDLSDGLSDFIWAQTRDDAIDAFDSLGVTLMTGLPNMHFLGIVIALVLMAAMLFMWVTLFVREALIYLVVIYAVSFGLPSMIFPPLRDTAKKVLELLVALIIAKPVMVLALSVGVSALGGIGATGEPGDPVGDNLARELGTLVSGVITFGLAAFMPFLVWKLMPIVAAAVVAQGIASAPMRGGTPGDATAVLRTVDDAPTRRRLIRRCRLDQPGGSRFSRCRHDRRSRSGIERCRRRCRRIGRRCGRRSGGPGRGRCWCHTGGDIGNQVCGVDGGVGDVELVAGDGSDGRWGVSGRETNGCGAIGSVNGDGRGCSGRSRRRSPPSAPSACSRHGWRSPGTCRCRSVSPSLPAADGCGSARSISVPPTRSCPHWPCGGGVGCGRVTAGTGRSRSSLTVRHRWRCRPCLAGSTCSRWTSTGRPSATPARSASSATVRPQQ